MNILSLFAQTTTEYYYTTSDTMSTSDAAAATAAILFVAFIVLLFSVGFYIFMSLCLMQIFKKAGVKPWIAWVPFYNNWKLLEIGGQQGFWAVLAIIPVVSIVSAVFMYIAAYNIGLKLNKSGAFVILAIFLFPIWLIALALDKSTWNESAGAPSIA